MAFTYVAAIGNLSEQVGITLKKMDFGTESIFFFRKLKKSFHFEFVVSIANSFFICLHNRVVEIWGDNLVLLSLGIPQKLQAAFYRVSFYGAFHSCKHGLL
jgi:hypothetical protein